MKIRDITLFYCSDSAQQDGIIRVRDRYRVRELDGMRFMEQAESMISTIEMIQAGHANVIMTNIRVIYILDTLTSAQSFEQMADELLRIYDRGRGLFSACNLVVIWKTDSMKMSECYQHIADSLQRLEEGEVATKLMLVSQRNAQGSILRGIDGETASTLAVMSACGELDTRRKGVFIYETKQLSILQEDIDSILNSQIIRQLDKLPDRVFSPEMQSAERREYQQELWKLFFDEWSGEFANGDRLEHIMIDRKVQSLLPEGVDFCVFAPSDYNEIHRALDFFDDENASRLLEKLPQMLVDDWREHALSVLEKYPDLYNKDVQAFFRTLGEQNPGVEMGSASQEIPVSEPKPALWANKDKFYMDKLVEQAGKRLTRYTAKVRSSFLKALPKVCAELASVVIPEEIDRRDQLLDGFKADGQHRYVLKEELERFRAYNTDIVDAICARVQERINRRYLRNYAHARNLVVGLNPCRAREAWKALIQACRGEVMRNLNIRNLIQQINSLPLEEINNGHIKSNDKLMAIGHRVSPIKTSGFCVMSSEIIDPNKQRAIAQACGVDLNAFELLDHYNNVSAVLEYQLLAQSGEDDSETRSRPEKVFPQIVVWDYEPIFRIENRERIRNPEQPTAQPDEPLQEEGKPENSLDWLNVEDAGDHWVFQSDRWDSHYESASIRVNIRALAADGIAVVDQKKTFAVGRGGNSRFTISKDGFYGLCHVNFSRNGDSMGNMELQGRRITCSYELRQLRNKGVEVDRDGGVQLLRYKVIIRDETGNGSMPILQNGEMLAASYASGESGEWKAVRECVFYVSRGNKKANELEVFIPSGREDSLYRPDTGIYTNLSGNEGLDIKCASAYFVVNPLSRRRSSLARAETTTSPDQGDRKGLMRAI